MEAIDTTAKPAAAFDKKPEIRLKARAVSRGVAIGKIVCLYGSNRQFYRVHIEYSEIERELRRLRAGITLAKRQLTHIVSSKHRPIPDSSPGIFDAHRMLLADSSMLSEIESEISEQKVNAEWAIKLVTDKYIAKYKAIPDEHLRDRYIDLEDVSERILTSLGGGGRLQIPLGDDSIIAARELKPSTLVELGEKTPRAVLTENGGWTSHSFILARELNLPAVTGLKNLLRRVKTGDDVIVDGYNGLIILNPEKETFRKYAIPAAQFKEVNFYNIEDSDKPAKTLDGHEIRILANSDVPSNYRRAKRLGAKGVGLYRSEFLFNQSRGFPSENEQIEAYRKIADLAGNDGVKIRTFDLGAEQLLDQNANREKNPALGLRAIRLGLTYKNQLKIQLRALLRASFQRHIDIVLPMISGLSEIREIKAILKKESDQLAARGKEVGNPLIGAMIEVPAAVLMIKELAEETDFFCLGTNDLVQYFLAADRDNETVADWFRTLHPAVLRAIRSVLNTSRETGKRVIVCGEMAGSPYYIPILLGLGATELSMNAHSIPRVKRIISGIALEETHQLLLNIEPCRTVEEVENIVDLHFRKHWTHLFPADFLRGLRR